MVNNDSSPVEREVNRFDHSYGGIAAEARKAIGCDETWAEGDCFANLTEMNDHDPCARCHLAWRLASFEHEATEWWHELGVMDGELGFANADKNVARAAYRALADAIRECAPTPFCMWVAGVIEVAGVTESINALDAATDDVGKRVRPHLQQFRFHDPGFRIERRPHIAGGK